MSTAPIFNGQPIKTLLFSTLYPSSVRAGHGIFVETRLRELLKSQQVDTRVVAPVPWFPSTSSVFGEYAKFAATPKLEQHNGIEIHHPRYLLPPKIGMNMAPHSLAACALPVIRKLIRDGFDFDVIDAHYYYPDGVAAGIIAKQLNKPFIVTARGSDINLLTHFPYPRKKILETAQSAYASIGVSQALVDRMQELGVSSEKTLFFRNGVDLDRFKPENKEAARQIYSLSSAPLLLSVGNLVESKGHDIAISALPLLPDNYQLVIAGDGPDKNRLQLQAKNLNLEGRVHLVGRVGNEQLRWLFSAADALLLCSSREGWPNVLLESMACGTPVIATRTGGTPEIVVSPTAGTLIDKRTPEAVAEAVTQLLLRAPTQAAVRAIAETFSWQATTDAQLNLFKKIIHAS